MFTIQNFASWHRAFGEIVNSCSSDKQAIGKIANELRDEDETTLRTILLTMGYYHQLLKACLEKWNPPGFRISQGEDDIVRRAVMNVMTDKGMSTLNFVAARRISLPSHLPDGEILYRTPGKEIYEAIDKSLLLEIGDIRNTSRLIRTVEQQIDMNTIYREGSDALNHLPTDIIADVVAAQDAIRATLNCFTEGVYQMRLRRIRSMLLEMVLSPAPGPLLYMTDYELDMRAMRLIGEIDQAINTLNSRSSASKSQVEKTTDCRSFRAFIKGSCAAVSFTIPPIRDELKALILIASDRMRLGTKFPGFFEYLKSPIKPSGA